MNYLQQSKNYENREFSLRKEYEDNFKKNSN